MISLKRDEKRYCISIAAKLKNINALTNKNIIELTKNCVYKPKQHHLKYIIVYHSLIKNNDMNNELYDYMYNLNLR